MGLKSVSEIKLKDNVQRIAEDETDNMGERNSMGEAGTTISDFHEMRANPLSHFAPKLYPT